MGPVIAANETFGLAFTWFVFVLMTVFALTVVAWHETQPMLVPMTDALFTWFACFSVPVSGGVPMLLVRSVASPPWQ